jgi:3-hydroxypropanoate dehydrogenase
MPVNDAELSEIWELAKWAPTSANTQPLRILYVRPGHGRDRLVQHMNDANKAKTASAPWRSILVVNIGHPGPDPWFERLPRLDHEDAVRWE